jgi:hypothetical protein
MPTLKKLTSKGAALRDTLLASPLLHPEALVEKLQGRSRHLVLDEAELGKRLSEALDWLARSQDQGIDRGFARGYGLVRVRHFGSRGWQPSYPETTGYIIPTFLLAAHMLDRTDLRERALAAADWEIGIQLPSGAVRGGVVGEAPSPSTFNTGQVLFGWLSAYLETGEERFRDAVVRASDFLTSVQGTDDEWHAADSQFARHESTLYNARTAWALAEAGVLLEVEQYRESALRYLRKVVEAQHRNGWLPRCCLNDPVNPLLHTLAYAYRGLVEAGRLLGEDEVFEAGLRGAEALARAVDEDGRMAGRFREDWSGAVSWSCLTGQAQMASVWLRLERFLEDASWRLPAERALTFVASTQRLTASEGVRGGIKGSFPVSGEYGRYEVLNWATKFFADGLLRLQMNRAKGGTLDPQTRLAALA